jgi:hypothetical protein
MWGDSCQTRVKPRDPPSRTTSAGKATNLGFSEDTSTNRLEVIALFGEHTNLPTKYHSTSGDDSRRDEGGEDRRKQGAGNND